MTLSAIQQQPYYQAGAGIRTEFGTLVPPGSNVFYVRSTGASIQDPPEIAKRIDLTLAAALLKCRAGYGDIIVCLPGHSESVTSTPTFIAGVKITSPGHGSNRAVFRWTATTSTWTVAAADVIISNLRLRLEGASGVTKAISVTAADVQFDGCDIETASGASNGAIIGIELGTGAARATISNCRFRGVTYASAANVVKITGTAQDGIRILNSTFFAPGHVTTGLIQVNNAATNLDFSNLRMYNTTASSTACICLDDFASDGLMSNIDMADKNNGTATAQGITFGSSTLVQCSRTYEVDEVKKNSILSPAVGT